MTRTAEQVAKELFDRLYGVPREELDERELKIISEVLKEYAKQEVDQAIDDIALGLREHEVTQKIRAAALEEAAKVCGGHENCDEDICVDRQMLAERIRALQEATAIRFNDGIKGEKKWKNRKK